MGLTRAKISSCCAGDKDMSGERSWAEQGWGGEEERDDGGILSERQVIEDKEPSSADQGEVYANAWRKVLFELRAESDHSWLCGRIPGDAEVRGRWMGECCIV